MAVNAKSMSGEDTLSMHLRAFTERIPPTGSLREMSGDSDLLVHPVHVRYRIKPILLYPDYSYISYRSIPKPAVVALQVPTSSQAYYHSNVTNIIDCAS